MLSHTCWMFDLFCPCIWPKTGWPVPAGRLNLPIPMLYLSIWEVGRWMATSVLSPIPDTTISTHHLFTEDKCEIENTGWSQRINWTQSQSEQLTQSMTPVKIHQNNVHMQHTTHSTNFHTDGSGARPVFETRSCHGFQANLKHKCMDSHDDAWLPYFWNDWLLLNLDTELTYHGEITQWQWVCHLPIRTDHTGKGIWELGSGHRASAFPIDLLFKVSYSNLCKTLYLPSTPCAFLWGRFL